MHERRSLRANVKSETPLTVSRRIDVAAGVDADRLNELAAAVLSTDEYIAIIRGPAGG